MYSFKSVAPRDANHVLRDIDENGYTTLLGFEWSEWKERGIDALAAFLKEANRRINMSIKEDAFKASQKGLNVRPVIIVFGQEGDFTSEQEEELSAAGGIFHNRNGDNRDGGEILMDIIQSAQQIYLN